MTLNRPASVFRLRILIVSLRTGLACQPKRGECGYTVVSFALTWQAYRAEGPHAFS